MLAPFNPPYQVGDRSGIGFNRRTWNAGRTLGTRIKNYITRGSERRSATIQKKRQKKKPTTSFTPTLPQIPTAGGDSRSYFKLKKPLKSKIGKLELTPGLIINNSSFRIEAQTGFQNSAILATYYTDVDVNQHFTLSDTSASAKVFLQSVHGEALITNQCNVNARITIYDVLARRDANAGATDPQYAFANGFADNTGGLAANYSVPGASPYDNPRFVEYFKILRKTPVILSPGAVHSHEVHYAPNQMFSHEITSYTLSSAIGGLTLYTFMVFHGSPINDKTTQTQVSLAHQALDVVQKEAYRYKYCSVGHGVASITQTIPTSFTVAGNVMEDDGNVLAEAEA